MPSCSLQEILRSFLRSSAANGKECLCQPSERALFPTELDLLVKHDACGGGIKNPNVKPYVLLPLTFLVPARMLSVSLSICKLGVPDTHKQIPEAAKAEEGKLFASANAQTVLCLPRANRDGQKQQTDTL